MGITRLYTADIYVHDLDKAVDFYVDKLGFEKRADEPVDEEGHRWVEVAPNGSETALVLSHGFGSWSPEKVGGTRAYRSERKSRSKRTSATATARPTIITCLRVWSSAQCAATLAQDTPPRLEARNTTTAPV
jgi:Glyoxalase/Bleomycin resistance protein/Dioxygenase superfamily